jgi:hypothetical protein
VILFVEALGQLDRDGQIDLAHPPVVVELMQPVKNFLGECFGAHLAALQAFGLQARLPAKDAYGL